MTLAQECYNLPREKIHGKYMPADAFFASLAAEQGSLALGVVLSGLDGDGALGVAAIRAALPLPSVKHRQNSIVCPPPLLPQVK